MVGDDLDYLSWSRAGGFPDALFINLRCGKWSVGHKDARAESLTWTNGLTIARIDTNPAPRHYVTKAFARYTSLAEITRLQAQEMYLHLRRENGRGAVTKCVHLDERHVRLFVPTRLVPGHVGKVPSVIGWPIDVVDISHKMICRSEALQLLVELLNACSIELKEDNHHARRSRR